MSLKEAAQQGLDALEIAMKTPINEYLPAECLNAIKALRTALSDAQDWNEVDALRASLREHMAEIHRLREAGRRALEALENDPVLANANNNAMAWLRAALEPVTDCHDKEGDKLSTSLDHIPDAGKMVATVKQSLIVEPVGYGVFEDGNLHDSFRLEHEAKLFAALKGEHAEVKTLYAAPPKRQPLTDCGEAGHDEGRCGNSSCLMPPKRKPFTDAELEPIRRRMMFEAYNAADDDDSERYNALKVMANDVLEMLMGVKK